MRFILHVLNRKLSSHQGKWSQTFPRKLLLVSSYAVVNMLADDKYDSASAKLMQYHRGVNLLRTQVIDLKLVNQLNLSFSIMASLFFFFLLYKRTEIQPRVCSFKEILKKIG